MKTFIVLGLFLVLSVIVSARPAEETYSDELDGIDEDEILNNERLYNNYASCFKTGKKCTPEGQRIRDVIPEALKTKCGKCNETQKTKTRKIIKWIVKNKPDDFLEIEKIFDPDHKYRTDFGDELKAEGVILPALK